MAQDISPCRGKLFIDGDLFDDDHHFSIVPSVGMMELQVGRSPAVIHVDSVVRYMDGHEQRYEVRASRRG